MPKEKIQELFPVKYENKQNLEKNWQNFLKRDTYLINDEKRKFFQEINQLTKFPRRSLFKFKERGQIRKFRKKLHKFIEEVDKYNQKFVERRLKTYKSFLDGKDDGLKYPLDEEQRLAVIKDNEHNLVIAGAGSGKIGLYITQSLLYRFLPSNKD